MLNRALLVLNICCKSNAAVTLRLKVFAKTSDINGVQNNGQLQSAEHAAVQSSHVRNAAASTVQTIAGREKTQLQGGVKLSILF
jgi:hypothetical protein